MLRNLFQTPAFRVGVVVAVALVIGIWWYSSTREPAPREEDRVVHPSGYSMIKPQGWGAAVDTRPSAQEMDYMQMTPDKYVGDRPLIRVSRLTKPQDPNELRKQNYSDIILAGRPALMFEKPRKTKLNVLVDFEDHGQWFEIVLSLPGLEGTQRKEYWRYLETFRYSPTSQANMAPTTGPAMQPMIETNSPGRR